MDLAAASCAMDWTARSIVTHIVRTVKFARTRLCLSMELPLQLDTNEDSGCYAFFGIESADLNAGSPNKGWDFGAVTRLVLKLEEEFKGSRSAHSLKYTRDGRRANSSVTDSK